MSALRWQWSRFEDLSPGELYAAMKLRQRVFVVEQNCAYQDADGRDAKAWHLLGWTLSADREELVAYARVFEAGVRYDNEASVGRIVTSPASRGKGYGRLLMNEAVRRCVELSPGAPIKLGAQMYLENFYREFGFETVTSPYDEDRIMHVDMVRKPVRTRT